MNKNFLGVIPMKRLSALLLPVSLLLLRPGAALAESLPPLATVGSGETGDSAKTLQVVAVVVGIFFVLYIILKWVFIFRRLSTSQAIIGPPPPPRNWRPEDADASRPGQPAQGSDPPAAAN